MPVRYWHDLHDLTQASPGARRRLRRDVHGPAPGAAPAAGRSERQMGWDRLVVALGSVSRMFPVPGLAEHAVGFKTLAEAIHLRNHVLEQLELADATEDPDERTARLGFVVVGAGYAGTELIAELQALVRRALRLYPALRHSDTRWVLADMAPRVLPELGGRLSDRALQVLRGRGVQIRLETTLEQVGPDWVRFTGGEWMPATTIVWTAGVMPDPLAGKLGLASDERGRIVVDEHLAVAGRDDVFAVGDVAAVPIAGPEPRTAPPTAQHALRQARVCADNLASTLGHGQRRRFAFAGWACWSTCRSTTASGWTGRSPRPSRGTSPSWARSAPPGAAVATRAAGPTRFRRSRNG